MKLLVIEDDTATRDYLSKGLREAGHVVDTAADGKQGLFLATTETYDAWIVDRMLPHVDGLKIIATLRATGSRTPALILSALGEVDDRVRGLRAGGDDYLVKPFAFAELAARVEAITRRGQAEDGPQTRLEVADLKLDLLARTAHRGDTAIDLKPQEFRLLEFLMRRAGQVVTRTMLLEGVWDYHFDPQTNVVDVHISRLRGKVDLPGLPALIHTVRGAGYALREPS
jgi:two-component system OmpR family response regulator